MGGAVSIQGGCGVRRRGTGRGARVGQLTCVMFPWACVPQADLFLFASQILWPFTHVVTFSPTLTRSCESHL